ncbi:MAG: DUF3109 family protein [Bacteroidales bacterium]|jgi:hypothetical protein|nr:DUF3109 family protein [Bacteroidales bacterium]
MFFDNVIISDNLFEEKFFCDVPLCKGACCIDGDAGAPLGEMEIAVLEDIVDAVKPYMTAKGRAVVEKNGVFDFDMEGCFATPLVAEKECAFVCLDDDGIARCAIEKACQAGALKGLSDDDQFNKPISCHLYPIRLVTKENGFIELKYHKWDVCYYARKKGKELNISVFEFLKYPLIRRFGEEWYEKIYGLYLDRCKISL